MAKLNVLLTGANGRIGKVFTPAFREMYNLRTLDRQPNPLDPELIVGDLQDCKLLESTMRGIDIVVHLAATSDEAPFLEELVPNNVVGLYNVYETAQKAGVRRIVFASTCQTVPAGCWNRQHLVNRPIDIDEPPRPMSIYGVTKVFGETLGRYYHDYRGMEFVGIRIGCFIGPQDMADTASSYIRNLWLSHGDAIDLFSRAIEKPGVGYTLVFGTSVTENELMSRESARRLLGFRPQDGVAEAEPTSREFALLLAA